MLNGVAFCLGLMVWSAAATSSGASDWIMEMRTGTVSRGTINVGARFSGHLGGALSTGQLIATFSDPNIAAWRNTGSESSLVGCFGYSFTLYDAATVPSLGYYDWADSCPARKKRSGETTPNGLKFSHKVSLFDQDTTKLGDCTIAAGSSNYDYTADSPRRVFWCSLTSPASLVTGRTYSVCATSTAANNNQCSGSGSDPVALVTQTAVVKHVSVATVVGTYSTDGTGDTAPDQSGAGLAYFGATAFIIAASTSKSPVAAASVSPSAAAGSASTSPSVSISPSISPSRSPSPTSGTQATIVVRVANGDVDTSVANLKGAIAATGNVRVDSSVNSCRSSAVAASMSSVSASTSVSPSVSGGVSVSSSVSVSLSAVSASPTCIACGLRRRAEELRDAAPCLAATCTNTLTVTFDTAADINSLAALVSSGDVRVSGSSLCVSTITAASVGVSASQPTSSGFLSTETPAPEPDTLGIGLGVGLGIGIPILILTAVLACKFIPGSRRVKRSDDKNAEEGNAGTKKKAPQPTDSSASASLASSASTSASSTATTASSS